MFCPVPVPDIDSRVIAIKAPPLWLLRFDLKLLPTGPSSIKPIRGPFTSPANYQAVKLSHLKLTRAARSNIQCKCKPAQEHFNFSLSAPLCPSSKYSDTSLLSPQFHLHFRSEPTLEFHFSRTIYSFIQHGMVRRRIRYRGIPFPSPPR